MSVTVETTTEERCVGCTDDPTKASHRLSASGRHGAGGAIPLCPAHAIRMWNALGAMLMMHDPPLLKTVGGGALPNAAGKKLL